MNKKNSLFIFILIFSLHFSPLYSQIQDFNFLFTEKIAYNECIKKQALSTNKGPKGIGDNYDLKYHRFNWLINTDTCYIIGSVTSYFKTTKNNVSTINFSLYTGLIVDSVKFHNQKITFFHGGNDSLSINLSVTLANNILDSVTVFYKGVPSIGIGFGSFKKAFHGSPPTPIIWTLSEPYGAADWWPCKNDNRDKIDSTDFFITTQNYNKAGTAGVLVSTVIDGDWTTYHWKHRYPIAPYLIGISVTNFIEVNYKASLGSNTTDSVNVLNYIYPEENLDGNLANSCKEVLECIKVYSDLFGRYPFWKEKYGHMEFDAGGGMEHQTMSSMTSSCGSPCNSFWISGQLQAHELGHQWFGNKITCASWQDIWLHEGIDTYVTGLWFEKIVVDKWWWWFWKYLTVKSVVSQPGGTVFVYGADTNSVSRVFDSRLSYSKGGMVMHMLRLKLGDSIFFKALYDYMHDPALEWKTATTDDVIYHFENNCQCNLDDYFDKWIYKEGFPIYNINMIFDPITTNATIQINQTTSVPSSVSFFDLTLPFTFKTTGNTQVKKVLLNNTTNGQVFNVNVGFQPDSIFFDRDWEIIHKMDTMIVSIKNVSIYEPNIKIYPNPVQDFINISAANESISKIEIFNITGENLIKEITDINSNNYIVDVSAESKGIYFIKITTVGGAFTIKKIVKM